MRAAVATLLGQLIAQPLHGPRVTLLLSRLLPPGLVGAIQVRLCLQYTLHHSAHGAPNNQNECSTAAGYCVHSDGTLPGRYCVC